MNLFYNLTELTTVIMKCLVAAMYLIYDLFFRYFMSDLVDTSGILPLRKDTNNVGNPCRPISWFTTLNMGWE